jgi:hypothetical protein
MMQLRALVLSCLALVMTVTGVGVGMARGTMAADGQLCSVTGPAPGVLAHDGLPLFDADGDPVVLDRDACLDCLIAAFDLLPATSRIAAPDTTVIATLRHSSSDWMPTGACPGGLARAPPLAA